MPKIASILLCGLALWGAKAYADDPAARTPWGVSVAGSLNMGEFGSPNFHGQDWRTVENFAVDVFPSYQIARRWHLGLDIDGRWQGQLTSTSESGGTNLQGAAVLLGVGARYAYSDLWAFQASLDAYGDYWFSRASSQDRQARLEQPLGLKFKAQYFFSPTWSLDVLAEAINWSITQVGSDRLTNPTNEFTVGIGITYYFGAAAGALYPVTVPPVPSLENRTGG